MNEPLTARQEKALRRVLLDWGDPPMREQIAALFATIDAERERAERAEAQVERLREQTEATLKWLGRPEDWSYSLGVVDLWEGVYGYVKDIAARETVGMSECCQEICSVCHHTKEAHGLDECLFGIVSPTPCPCEGFQEPHAADTELLEACREALAHPLQFDSSERRVLLDRLESRLDVAIPPAGQRQ